MRFSSYIPVTAFGLGVLLISGMRQQYAVEPRAPMSTIDRTLAGFTGKDLTIPAEERRVAGMTDYVMRVFGPDSSAAFTTYVGYYDRQVQGKAIHSPKNCLPGAGWEILRSNRVSLGLQGIPSQVNEVLLSNRGTRALVLYWYQGRGRIEPSEYMVKWNLLRDAALMGRTEEALVRIVVPVSAPDENSIASASEIARKVARELVPEVTRVLPLVRPAS